MMPATILTGYQLYHNYFREHEGLAGKTPAEIAGIRIEGRNEWITVIQNTINQKCKREKRQFWTAMHPPLCPRLKRSKPKMLSLPFQQQYLTGSQQSTIEQYMKPISDIRSMEYGMELDM